MGEPKNPHFYDFGIFERVPGSQNQLSLSLEPRRNFKQIKKAPGAVSKDITFINIKNVGHQVFVDLGKDRRRQILPIRLINS